ncbi:hypothetical protein BJ170DRAFT_421112 [Xylariales sp. AK1849]|nr:hypothetical protein BJ170DRAFT_421112 [Xylariales sp. AK1849]
MDLALPSIEVDDIPIEARITKEPYDHAARTDSYFSNTNTQGVSGPRGLARGSQTGALSQDSASVVRRAGCAPEAWSGGSAELVKRPIQSRSIIPWTCYRLLDNGRVAVSQGHPTDCACRWNGRPAIDEGHYIPTLPVYPVYAPPQLGGNRQKYLHLTLDNCPQFYTFEKFGIMSFNPFKQPDVVDTLTGHPLLLEATISTGTVFDLLRYSNKECRTESQAVARSVASVCRLVSHNLSSPRYDNFERDLMVHCIGNLAIAAIWTDDVPTWHIHMQGLWRYIDATGGESKLEMNAITKLVFVEIEGAVITGQAPYFPSTRRQQLLPCFLSANEQEAIIETLRPLMEACDVKAAVTDTVIAVAIFNRTLRLYRERMIGVKFDPDNVMEDYHCLQHQLLAFPQPFSAYMNVSAGRHANTFSGSNSTETLGANVMSFSTCLQALERALRLSTLICLRASTLESLWSRRAYLSLLSYLVQQLQVMLAYMRRLQQPHAFVDPYPGCAIIARPFLIWMCILGKFLSTYFNVYYGGGSGHNPEGSVYFQVLQEIGILTDTDVDSVTDSDLRICRMLNLSWATGHEWDEKGILRRILRATI